MSHVYGRNGHRYPRDVWFLLRDWRAGRALSREQLERLEGYCRSRGIDPNDLEGKSRTEWAFTVAAPLGYPE